MCVHARTVFAAGDDVDDSPVSYSLGLELSSGITSSNLSTSVEDLADVSISSCDDDGSTECLLRQIGEGCTIGLTVISYFRSLGKFGEKAAKHDNASFASCRLELGSPEGPLRPISAPRCSRQSASEIAASSSATAGTCA